VDDECPLCVSKMDIDDLSFKPCPCGYQVGLSERQLKFKLASLTSDHILLADLDLSLLLSQHQRKPQWQMSCVSERLQ